MAKLGPTPDWATNLPGSQNVVDFREAEASGSIIARPTPFVGASSAALSAALGSVLRLNLDGRALDYPFISDAREKQDLGAAVPPPIGPSLRPKENKIAHCRPPQPMIPILQPPKVNTRSI
jgi:hypothetical protein